MRMSKALSAWGSPEFTSILKSEIEQLGVEHLPLQQAMTTGSYASDSGLSAMIITVSEEAGSIRVKSGIFYSGIIAGCSCADDPTPMDETSEYCVVEFDIKKDTGEVSITPVGE
jgi:hypothetical protein